MRQKIIKYKPSYNKNAIRKWTNKLSNIPCFLIGCGPSLNDVNINLISDYFSIGINDAYRKIHPTILLWQDLQFWYQTKKYFKTIKSILYCRSESDPSNLFYHFNLYSSDFQLCNNPTELFGRGASGPLAFQLAFNLGCNPIVLLGFDCKYRGKKTDFYGINNFHKPGGTLRGCRGGLNWIYSIATTNNRKIINCSDNDIFPIKYSLEEAIKLCESNNTISGKINFIKCLFDSKD